MHEAESNTPLWAPPAPQSPAETTVSNWQLSTDQQGGSFENAAPFRMEKAFLQHYFDSELFSEIKKALWEKHSETQKEAEVAGLLLLESLPPPCREQSTVPAPCHQDTVILSLTLLYESPRVPNQKERLDSLVKSGGGGVPHLTEHRSPRFQSSFVKPASPYPECFLCLLRSLVF